ncbi:transcription-repair coupling factor [Neptuniibacter sp. QD37_11]|uniref:transcription-repair coupling factor n=1 Tax=Neptuniibacter sp. QD37_11 TaxID=3398209 RepID=UPI0039F62274
MKISCSGSGRSLHFSHKARFSVIFCESDHEAQHIKDELHFFHNVDLDSIHILRDVETLPYDTESPSAEIISERGKILHALATQNLPRCLIISVPAAMRRFSQPSFWTESTITLKIGDGFDSVRVKEQLKKIGYIQQNNAADFGDFTIRNNRFDVVPLGSEDAYRIFIDDQNTIYDIKVLNTSSQLSGKSVGTINILPRQEFPICEAAIKEFARNWRATLSDVSDIPAFKHPIYSAVREGLLPSGIEYYQAFFTTSATIAEYLPKNANISFYGNCEAVADQLYNTALERFTYMSSVDPCIVPVDLLWQAPTYFASDRLKKSNYISEFPDLEAKTTGNSVSRCDTLNDTISMLRPAVADFNKVLFCANTESRVEHIQLICKLLGKKAEVVANWAECQSADDGIYITLGQLHTGFKDPASSLLVITEAEVFGEAILQKSFDGDDTDNDVYSFIEDLKSLKPGDPLVHLSYGVGRYKSLGMYNLQGVEKEYLTISYAEDATAYVPMSDLHLVSSYSGIDNEKAPLDKMGSEKWLKGLNDSSSNIADTAQLLIKLHAARDAEQGISFEEPDYQFERFCHEFPFQDTPDQRRAVSDIIADMTSPRPMDRLVAGDVGFGKTEVAMRAAFLAVQSGKQVAIIVPTLLLAKQHVESFRKRFSLFKIEIEEMTRFDNKSEERAALARLISGEAKIVIGTHKIIQDSVKFNNLGLLIIDEEHRFGVKQKEALRAKRGKLDVLAMTATPIPRTLSSTMHGIKDMSVLATPPAKRLSIRTSAIQWDEDTIQLAVQRERARNGQIFFLHNRVETIEEAAERIQIAAPNERVRFAHGQMSDVELEEIMSAFYRHEFDILVSTTIIETGIDVPNANTIIIDDADKLGLAQLHQLRGRVGRSNHQAYCYLISSGSESEAGSKRLKAMEEVSALGEGFILANHDLEIRGAGEILGEEQSGHITKIGFGLYLRLLERAVEQLKAGKSIIEALKPQDPAEIQLSLSGYIPQTYIEHDIDRLSFYKRLTSASTPQEIDQLEAELEDRFGEVPLETFQLIIINQLRALMHTIGIKKLVAGAEDGYLEFEKDNQVEMEKVLMLLARRDSGFSYIDNKLKFSKPVPNVLPDRIEMLFETLGAIAK